MTLNTAKNLDMQFPDSLLEFASSNEKYKWNSPILRNINEARSLFENDSVGWIKIDKEFPLSAWEQEKEEAEPYYVQHRNNTHRGWKSCCIHGISIDTTVHKEHGEFKWSELSEKVPSITKFWKEFPCESFKRIRFMKLEAGGYINIHNDLPNDNKLARLKDLNVLGTTVAINVAITNPVGCRMIIEGCGSVPWTPGDIFIINNTKNHCVINQGTQDRIHMIAECVIGERMDDFINLVYQGFKNNVLSDI
jgi:hypothetical protein